MMLNVKWQMLNVIECSTRLRRKRMRNRAVVFCGCAAVLALCVVSARGQQAIGAADSIDLSAVSGPEQTVTLGAVYPDDIRRTKDESRYKFQIELTTLGAAVKTATLSEFDNRDIRNRQPQVLLAPLGNIGRCIRWPIRRQVARRGRAVAARSFPLDQQVASGRAVPAGCSDV